MNLWTEARELLKDLKWLRAHVRARRIEAERRKLTRAQQVTARESVRLNEELARLNRLGANKW